MRCIKDVDLEVYIHRDKEYESKTRSTLCVQQSVCAGTKTNLIRTFEGELVVNDVAYHECTFKEVDLIGEIRHLTQRVDLPQHHTKRPHVALYLKFGEWLYQKTGEVHIKSE